jgi:hypothetical protein
MPKKKALDAKKLIKMVKEETPQPEIMKTFGYKTSLQLKNAYYRALVETGEIAELKGGRSSRKAKKAKTVGVGKRGSIIIGKDFVDDLGVGVGEKFSVRKTKAGIALKKVVK